LYPLAVSFSLLVSFAYTLIFPPAMIFRFAVVRDKSITGSLAEKRIQAQCRAATLVWCVFFVINGGVSAATVFFASDAVWAAYNGGVSYILIGLLFAGEMMVHTMLNKRLPKAVFLSEFSHESRPGDAVVAYSGIYSQASHKTWKDFLSGTATLRRTLRKNPAQKWLLYCEDSWYFLLGLTALLQCGKPVYLTANISPAYLEEIREPGMAFLTDNSLADSFCIPSLLTADEPSVSAEEAAETPKIIRDETVLLLYTSGSTGKPKIVQQRLTEMETENKFILSRWGEDYLTRKLCSTVSHQHIYGILFTILLPFTAGTPFRRDRVQYPGELE
jgi:hypothetical protein